MNTKTRNLIIDTAFSTMVALTVAAFILKPSVAEANDDDKATEAKNFIAYEYAGTITQDEMEARMKYDLMTAEEIKAIMEQD